MFVTENLELLKTLAIVSHIELLDKPPADDSYSFKSADIPGVILAVTKAPGEKCGRCWHYRTTVGVDPGYPSICDRCVENLKHSV